MSWDADEQPWIRRQDDLHANASTGGESGPGALCYFCGSNTVKRGLGDVPEDTGRIGVYCDNQMCDAREVTIIVERDGHGAQFRADVRALRELEGLNVGGGSLGDVMARLPNSEQRRDARRNEESFTLDVE